MDWIRFNFRLHPRIWRLVGNVTKNGWRSTSLKLFKRGTYNITNRQLTIDTPGPGSVTIGRKRRRSTSRRRRS